MRRHISSTSSGSHRLSIDKDVDIKLYEALGKNIVFALGKMSAFDKMRFKYNNELERMSFYNNEENIDPTSSMVSMSMLLLYHMMCFSIYHHISCIIFAILYMQPLMSNSVHSAISLERDDLDDNEETDTLDHESASSGLFVICPSSKPITLAWYPTKTIGQVKSELQARLGLLPSQYLLHIKGSKMLSEDSCSLSDYGIHKNANLEVLLPLRGGPSKVEELVVDIDERLKNKISELDSEHGLQLHKRSDEEMAVRLRDMSNRKIVMKAFNIQLNERRDDQIYRQLKRDELINSFILQRDAGFPLLKWSLMSPAERKADKRANETPGKARARLDANAKSMAQVRANETPEETRARLDKVANRSAQTRSDKKTAIEERWPTCSTLQGEKPGKDYKLERHTDNVETTLHLFHLESGGWKERESEWLIAYLHVMKRLAEADDSCISKLNGLLELSIKRYSTLYKLLYQEVLDDNDLKQVCKWKSQTEHRQLMNRKEAVLEWFATTDSISLDDCKAENGIFNCRSLVGLLLKVPAHWWVGCSGNWLWRCEVESIDFHDAAERYFTIKCLDRDIRWHMKLSVNMQITSRITSRVLIYQENQYLTLTVH